MCNRVFEALSGSSTEQMKEATEELKAHLLTLEEVKRAKAESMSQFGIGSISACQLNVASEGYLPNRKEQPTSS